MNSKTYLFRGISEHIYKENGTKLIPKTFGSFKHQFNWGDVYWGEFTWGPSEHNAVLRHQLNQEGFSTSGISTTPHFERARFYATHESETGRVLNIDKSILTKVGAKEYVVSEFSESPSIPEDNEAILVSNTGGELPQEIVVEVIQVTCSARHS